MLSAKALLNCTLEATSRRQGRSAHADVRCAGGGVGAFGDKSIHVDTGRIAPGGSLTTG